LQENKKVRRATMGEARKKIKVKETREKLLEEIKVRDYIDIAKELTGLVKENYFVGFQLGLSLRGANSKTINNQIEQWISAQESYATLMRELLERFPTEAVNFWGNPKFVTNHGEKIIALQKDYASVVMNTSDRFMKEALTLMRSGINRVFSSFNDYMNLIRGQ
jgi:hypothetical protein